ncbi:MAG: hypothetical protein GX824_01175 [Clostridiales bacterium]|nr:hypothetical protein [Clostridiales bacterium]
MELLIKYWYLVLAIIAVLILTVFVIIKAAKSVRLSRIEKENFIKKLEHEKDLRQSFKVISNESFNIPEKYRLLEGLAMNVQMQVENQTDTAAAFLALPAEKQHIYALCVLFDDCRENPLSFFFKANGFPLTPATLEAAERIIGGRFFELFKYEYSAFDKENAEVSLITEEILKTDGEFSALIKMNIDSILDSIVHYINQNKSVFITTNQEG